MSVAELLSRSRRVITSAAVAAFAVAGIALAAPAHAAPSASELEHQMETTWSKLEAAGEKWKQAEHDLHVNQAESAKLAKQIKPLEAKVATMYKQVGSYASAAYKGGTASALNSILTSGSPTTMLDSIATLDRMSQLQYNRVSGYITLKNSLDAKKAKYDKLVAGNKATAARLAKEKKTLSASMNNLQSQYQQTAAAHEGGANLASLNLPYVPGPAGKAVRYAEAHLGDPYVWDTAGPNEFDCSGLTMAAWAQAGVSMQHYTYDQYSAFPHVSESELIPGDLVFWNGGEHVGIYIGKGYVIHAPTPGEVVKVSPVDYPGTWYGAVRP